MALILKWNKTELSFISTELDYNSASYDRQNLRIHSEVGTEAKALDWRGVHWRTASLESLRQWMLFQDLKVHSQKVLLARPLNTMWHPGSGNTAVSRSYLSPGQGRGRFHSCLPSQLPTYSSILVWWRWGPAHYHRDWRHWDYSSIPSCLLWVGGLQWNLRSTEEVYSQVQIMTGQRPWACVPYVSLTRDHLPPPSRSDSPTLRQACPWVLNFGRFLIHSRV